MSSYEADGGVVLTAQILLRMDRAGRLASLSVTDLQTQIHRINLKWSHYTKSIDVFYVFNSPVSADTEVLRSVLIVAEVCMNFVMSQRESLTWILLQRH